MAVSKALSKKARKKAGPKFKKDASKLNAFVKSRSKQKAHFKKDKNISEGDDFSEEEGEEYEKKPRSTKEVKVRNLLPVKNKAGFVFRSEVVQEEEEEEPAESLPNAEEPKPQPQKELTLVERYAIQQKVLNDLKCKVALLCTSIVEDPENNLPAMKELMELLVNTKSKMVVSEKKILCFSLLHVFSDVLPGYKIRTQEKNPKVKLKKETRKLMALETNLLRYYKKYIDYLEKLIKDMRAKKKQKSKFSAVRIKVSKQVAFIAVKCLSELLSTRFSFNYFKNIANILVPLVIKSNTEISKTCCDAFEKMFKADKLGEASFHLVRQIVSFIRMKKFDVPACLIRCFLSLNLREAKVEEVKVDMKKGRKEWQNMSRKERRHKKKMKDLEAELKETQAHESVDTVRKFHIQTLNKIFWVFFHILKDGEKLYLLAPALEGLSKFAYLINLEFFNDLNRVLCGLMESGKLSDVDKLHSVYTLFTILAGQAESLHIDPHSIYCHMYEGLLKLGHNTDLEHFVLSLKCLDFNIIRKKRKISFGRILAFAKRVATISLQNPVHGALAFLACLREILVNVKGSDILLDTESTVGSGVYYPEMKDPEYCNAQSTALWELHLLKKHYSPFIKLYAQFLLHGCPPRGKITLPEALARSSPEDTLNLFADVAVFNKMDFLEESSEPPVKKLKLPDVEHVPFENEVDTELSWKGFKSLNFLKSVCNE